MPEAHNDQPAGLRRGLGNRTIQRGVAAHYAILAIRAARRGLRLLGIVAVAVIILFEQWGWRPLSAALVRITRFPAIDRIEATIVELPPYGALAVFLAPGLLFLPLKLTALWLITGGHVLAATLLFIAAKIAGTALYARIFHLTRPALMQLAWFARLYYQVVAWKDALVERAEATRTWQVAAEAGHRVRSRALSAWDNIRPRLVPLIRRLRTKIGF